MLEGIAGYLFLLVQPLGQALVSTVLIIAAGWSVADRLRLDPLAKLFVAGVIGFTIVYLLAFVAYLVSAPQWGAFAILLVLGLASVFDGVRRRLTADGAEPLSAEALPLYGLIAWLCLALWILSFQSRVVVYGGSSWFGDWYEHYERSIFFLDHLPASTTFLNGLWTLPARAPMFNAVIAVFLSVFGREFADYQTFATILNTFAVLPLALLLRDIAGLQQRNALLWSVVLLGIAPFAFEHEMFTWTKGFAFAFVLGGIYLYRAALVQNRAWLAGLSFGAFTAGVLAHYLVLVFATFFATHFLYTALRRRWNWRYVATPALACTLLVATWGIYIVANFGLQRALTANSTLGDYAASRPGPYGTPATHSVIFLGNLVTTIVPYSWRHEFTGMGNAPRMIQSDQRAGPNFSPVPTELNRQTEWFASIANDPSSLLGMLGFAGVIGVALAAVVSTRRRQTASPPAITGIGWKFWAIFFALGIPANIYLSPDYAPNGVGHLNLQPFGILVAVWLFWSLGGLALSLRALLVALFIFESAITAGALVQLEQRPVPLVIQDGKITITGKINLHVQYVNNYLLKLDKKAVFMSDRLGDLSVPFALMALLSSIALALAIASGNRRPAA